MAGAAAGAAAAAGAGVGPNAVAADSSAVRTAGSDANIDDSSLGVVASPPPVGSSCTRSCMGWLLVYSADGPPWLCAVLESRALRLPAPELAPSLPTRRPVPLQSAVCFADRRPLGSASVLLTPVAPQTSPLHCSNCGAVLWAGAILVELWARSGAACTLLGSSATAGGSPGG